MKKRTLIALIVAVCLIFVGGLLLTMGLSYAGNHPQESTLIQREVLISEPFDSVVIDTADCDVKFMPCNGDVDAQVVLLEQENANHSVMVEEGILKIKMTDKRNWTDHIGIYNVFGQSENMEMIVYLPAVEYESLQVRTATGDITLAQDPIFLNVLLRTSTGDISCVGAGGDVLDCMTSTGDISVQNSGADTLKLQSNTGDFAVSAVAGNEIHMRTTTGEVDAENVNVQMFTCKTDTGDVELEKVLAEDYLQVFTDNGSVEVNNSDAGAVNIETNTGDVSGHFLTPKWFSAFSDTGDVTVPNTPEGGECRIQTDSGDIHFK